MIDNDTPTILYQVKCIGISTVFHTCHSAHVISLYYVGPKNNTKSVRNTAQRLFFFTIVEIISTGTTTVDAKFINALSGVFFKIQLTV